LNYEWIKDIDYMGSSDSEEIDATFFSFKIRLLSEMPVFVFGGKFSGKSKFKFKLEFY